MRIKITIGFKPPKCGLGKYTKGAPKAKPPFKPAKKG